MNYYKLSKTDIKTFIEMTVIWSFWMSLLLMTNVSEYIKNIHSFQPISISKQTIKTKLNCKTFFADEKWQTHLVKPKTNFRDTWPNIWWMMIQMIRLKCTKILDNTNYIGTHRLPDVCQHGTCILYYFHNVIYFVLHYYLIYLILNILRPKATLWKVNRVSYFMLKTFI